MLHVSRLADRRGEYYTAELEADLGVKSPARWVGQGAVGLGLVGEPCPGELGEILSGSMPPHGRRLVTQRGHVCGFDLTFTAPKSVSIVAGIGTPDLCTLAVAAHDEAVAGAMDYVERRAVAVRRGSGESRSVQAVDGVVAVAYTHGVSRALDPHLHTHVVVANMGHGEDGRWSALDSRGIYAHAHAAGRLYDASLRYELSRTAGATWILRSSGIFDLAGIGPELIGTYSSRGAEIRSDVAQWLGARGGGRPASRRVERTAWAATRDPKVPVRTAALLRTHWQHMSMTAEIDLASLRAAGESPQRSPSLDEYRFAASLGSSPHSTAARRDVVAAWAGALAPGAPARNIEACADRLTAWSGGVGVAEARRPMAGLLPAAFHLRALGARPGHPDALDVWMKGVSAIDGYRKRWPAQGVRSAEDFDRPLAFTDMSAMPSQRLADHLATMRVVDDVRRRLGRSTDRSRDSQSLALGR
ncbi:MAG: relaxase domain-containing protein [Actinomycetota bacterium]|nr:relaxase domain-containing protein [Actinomycetota bacterium]